MNCHLTSHATSQNSDQLPRSRCASGNTLNSFQLQERVREPLRDNLSCLQDRVAGLVIPPLDLNKALPGHIHRKQAPLRSPTPPDVCRVGMTVNGQRNAMERLRRASNSHLPPRLLPGTSLAGPTSPINHASMNTYMSGATT